MSGFSFGAATPAQQGSTSLFGLGTPIGASTPSFGAPTAGQPQPQQPTLFSTTAVSSAAPATGFSFGTPATGQPPAQTGFSLGGLSTATATTSASTGFGFGSTGLQATAPTNATTTVTAAPSATRTTTVGGLGGIPGNAGAPRTSSLALGGDITNSWLGRGENRALQELPVPPEILASVEELKNHMKSYKTFLNEMNRSYDAELVAVSDNFEEVKNGFTNLVNLMHKQELQTAALIREMQALSKDLDILNQARENSYMGHTTQSLQNFVCQISDKYAARMLKYKQEIERAELSLHSLIGSQNLSAKELWSSLAAIKDTVILLAAQVQKLHEEMRQEIQVHKNVSQLLYGLNPRPWIDEALSVSVQQDSVTAPLEKALPPRMSSSGAGLENVLYHRPTSISDARYLYGSPGPEVFRAAADARNAALGLSSSYHPSMLGSYLGPSSPAQNASLKRSKK